MAAFEISRRDLSMDAGSLGVYRDLSMDASLGFCRGLPTDASLGVWTLFVVEAISLEKIVLGGALFLSYHTHHYIIWCQYISVP